MPKNGKPKNLKTKAGTHGGKRRNAGRKADPVRAAIAQQRASLSDRPDDVERMLRVLMTIADDEGAPPAARVNAANAAINQMLGTPAPRKPIEAEVKVKLSADEEYLKNLDRIYGPIAQRLGIDPAD